MSPSGELTPTGERVLASPRGPFRPSLTAAFPRLIDEVILNFPVMFASVPTAWFAMSNRSRAEQITEGLCLLDEIA
jgi:hypothetical protein